MEMYPVYATKTPILKHRSIKSKKTTTPISVYEQQDTLSNTTIIKGVFSTTIRNEYLRETTIASKTSYSIVHTEETTSTAPSEGELAVAAIKTKVLVGAIFAVPVAIVGAAISTFGFIPVATAWVAVATLGSLTVGVKECAKACDEPDLGQGNTYEFCNSPKTYL